MKLEATWILTNIGYGDEDEIIQIFADEYNLVKSLNMILNGQDLQMIDQAIWLMANSAGTSQKCRKMVLSQTYIIDCLARVTKDAINCQANLRISFLGNIIWCLRNLLRLEKQKNGAYNVADVLTEEENSKVLFVVSTLLTDE